MIIPITIRNYDYYKFIRNGLRKVDEEFYHFCLTARKDFISKRLLERGEKDGSWAFRQTDECLENYSKYDFSEYIDTEKINEIEVVNMILERVNNSK